MTVLCRGIALILVLGVPTPVSALHTPSHGLPSQPSSKQIDEFCDKYPGLIQSPNLSPQQKDGYQQAHEQYCKKKSAGKPGAASTLQGRIDRIDTPDCLSPDTEIRVEGEALQQGELACGLESKGRRTSLNAFSKTDRQFRYRLDGAMSRLPGPDFRVECEVKGDKEVTRIPACASGVTTVPNGAQGQEAGGEVDLVPEIETGDLQSGRAQTVEIRVRNLGRSEPKNQRHRLMLVLTNQDLSDVSRLTTTLSPATGDALAETRQWLTQIPGASRSETIVAVVNVPAQLPDGPLFWCAMADSDRTIPEFNEQNNLTCVSASDMPKTGLGLFGKKAKDLKSPTTTEGATLPIIADPRHDPIPADPDCDPVIYMWFDPEPHPALGVAYGFFYDDEGARAYYSVDCATGVSVFDVEYIPDPASTTRDGGAGAVFHSDAAAAGVLTDSRAIGPGATAGTYIWRISAVNTMRGGDPTDSEQLLWSVRIPSAEPVDFDTRLTIFDTPWRNFCSRDGYVFEGNLYAGLNYDGSSPFPARIVVHIGASTTSTDITVRPGSHSYSTRGTLFIPRAEICPDACIQYHLEARNPADASKLDSSLRSACAE